ncbi:hypothetical protein [Dokdonia sinensis]|uniref:hypothetical protein n=1 Tax=Dokdonia sinensis TaxID=2479847 RepID=UPI0013753680|nr:hypothetical protein [Dokdonia sinensis]
MGSWKLEAGSWKLEAGSWKLEAGSWKLNIKKSSQNLRGFYILIRYTSITLGYFFLK